MGLKQLNIHRINIVMDCLDAGIMAEFYSQLLGWEWTLPRANGWAGITSPTGAMMLFQEVAGYEPPVWPWEEGKPGQMLHLDLAVDNLEEAVDFAVQRGARVAGEQYYPSARTMLDPAGHPFCLFIE